MAYIAQYSKRAGTAAGKMDDNVAPKEKKRREKAINSILKVTALEHNKIYIGKTADVLVDSAKSNDCALGKTRSYKTVKFKTNGTDAKSLVGKFVKVEILKAQSFGLAGKLR